MALKLSGFDDLFDDLNNLGNVGKKIGRKAVQEGSKIVLEQQKKDAPKNTSESAKNLKVTKVKTYKSGNTWANIGIDGSNFNEVKGLYFNHYGFELWKNGERVEPHVGWMDESLKKVEDKASEKMMQIVSSELDEILR